MTKKKEDFDPRYIPADIKREVRQACAFGCVICRCPLYEYDHIEEYSVVGEHKAENLALLCPNCHFKKGKKQISKEWIRECKSSAKNRFLTSDRIQKVPYTIDLGSNLITSFKGGVIFYCRNFGYLKMGFTDSLSLSGVFYGADGIVALAIEDNELRLNNHIWDIEYTGSTIIFRHALRDVFLSVDINSDKKLIAITGKYFINDIPITISNKGICLDGNPIVLENIVQNANLGLVITEGLPINEHGEAVHGLLTGHVYRNTISGYVPIHIMNPSSVVANIIHSCHIAIYITHEFLIKYHKHFKSN